LYKGDGSPCVPEAAVIESPEARGDPGKGIHDWVRTDNAENENCPDQCIQHAHL
jgi:hypothetical protein